MIVDYLFEKGFLYYISKDIFCIPNLIEVFEICYYINIPFQNIPFYVLFKMKSLHSNLNSLTRQSKYYVPIFIQGHCSVLCSLFFVQNPLSISPDDFICPHYVTVLMLL